MEQVVRSCMTVFSAVELGCDFQFSAEADETTMAWKSYGSIFHFRHSLEIAIEIQ